MHNAILNQLSPDYPWKDQFFWFSSLGSTNDHLRQLAAQGAPHGTVILAGHQTNGHGRMGRSFQSPEGMGVYLSILLRPMCAPTELMHLTCAAAAAMCDAVEQAAGFRPGIKWTNDLVLGKRKLGGILTELRLSPQGNVEYAIIGIGINCRQTEADFVPEIRDMAASVSMITGRQMEISKMAAAMMEALARMDHILLTDKAGILERYRRDCVTLGQDISLIRGEEIRHGKALDLDADGGLIVAFTDGSAEVVSSGEVSIRGMYGYI